MFHDRRERELFIGERFVRLEGRDARCVRKLKIRKRGSRHSVESVFRTFTWRSTCRETSPCRANPSFFSYHYARRPYKSWPAYRARSNPTARHCLESTWQSYQLTLAIAVWSPSFPREIRIDCCTVVQLPATFRLNPHPPFPFVSF